MNKKFYNFSIVFLSVLGIGFVTRFRRFLTVLFALFVVLLIPDDLRPVILGILIVIYISFFAYIYDKIITDVNKNVLVFRYAVGIWIAGISPYVLVTWFWGCVIIVLYYIFTTIMNNIKIKKCNNEICEFLKKDIIAGSLTLIVMQIIYSATAILPFIWMYYYDR